MKREICQVLRTGICKSNRNLSNYVNYLYFLEYIIEDNEAINIGVKCKKIIFGAMKTRIND